MSVLVGPGVADVGGLSVSIGVSPLIDIVTWLCVRVPARVIELGVSVLVGLSVEII